MQIAFSIILAGVAAIFGSGEFEVPVAQQWLLDKRADEQSISLIRLISTPESFDGKYVSVQGYLVLRDRYEHSLFLDENSYKEGQTANSIAIDLGGSSVEIVAHAKERDRQYVVVTARFSVGGSAFSEGRLEGVYRLFSLGD